MQKMDNAGDDRDGSDFDRVTRDDRRKQTVPGRIVFDQRRVRGESCL